MSTKLKHSRQTLIDKKRLKKAIESAMRQKNTNDRLKNGVFKLDNFFFFNTAWAGEWSNCKFGRV